MRRLGTQHGQALILVTFASFSLFGLMALAVDLGWFYYVRKSEQSAVDAAAMGAATAALAQLGQTSYANCGTSVHCQPETPCGNPATNPPVTSLDNGCLYAQQSGYKHGGESGRQTVTMEAGTAAPPPTAPGVNADYWVTARVSNRVPQLFSFMLGRPGPVSAVATAAVVNVPIGFSLMLLNRENDCVPLEGGSRLTCGVDLMVSSNDNQGMPALRADGGISMASQANGQQADGRFAGENTGGGTIRSPITAIRGTGSYYLGGSSQWIERPTNSSDGAFFEDPMRGKGQPRPPTGLPDRPILNGTISGSSDPNNPVMMPPGNYFATRMQGGVQVATGDRLDVQGYVRFASGGSGFGAHVFFGGLKISNPSTNVTFDPGMYIVAGVKSGPLVSITANASMQDLTSGYGRNTDAGEIFIFTDPNYKGGGQALEIPAMVRPIASALKQGSAGFQTGNNASAAINLHGLNAESGALPQELRAFEPVLMWQDQANSTIKYTADGNMDKSCGSADGCPNTALADPASTELVMQGSPQVHMYGVIYQPRGTYTTVIGGGGYNAPVTLIVGSMRIQGNANFGMAQPGRPLARRMVALVQ